VISLGSLRYLAPVLLVQSDKRALRLVVKRPAAVMRTEHDLDNCDNEVTRKKSTNAPLGASPLSIKSRVGGHFGVTTNMKVFTLSLAKLFLHMVRS
jgi:hypothetical protein